MNDLDYVISTKQQQEFIASQMKETLERQNKVWDMEGICGGRFCVYCSSPSIFVTCKDCWEGRSRFSLPLIVGGAILIGAGLLALIPH